MLAEVVGDEDAEDDERDDLLDDFELYGAEVVSGADAVSWDLETVLEKGNQPADQDHLPQSFAAEAKVSVPGKRHEDVGDDEKNDRPH